MSRQPSAINHLAMLRQGNARRRRRAPWMALAVGGLLVGLGLMASVWAPHVGFALGYLALLLHVHEAAVRVHRVQRSQSVAAWVLIGVTALTLGIAGPDPSVWTAGETRAVVLLGLASFAWCAGLAATLAARRRARMRLGQRFGRGGWGASQRRGERA